VANVARQSVPGRSTSVTGAPGTRRTIVGRGSGSGSTVGWDLLLPPPRLQNTRCEIRESSRIGLDRSQSHPVWIVGFVWPSAVCCATRHRPHPRESSVPRGWGGGLAPRPPRADRRPFDGKERSLRPRRLPLAGPTSPHPTPLSYRSVDRGQVRGGGHSPQLRLGRCPLGPVGSLRVGNPPPVPNGSEWFAGAGARPPPPAHRGRRSGRPPPGGAPRSSAPWPHRPRSGKLPWGLFAPKIPARHRRHK